MTSRERTIARRRLAAETRMAAAAEKRIRIVFQREGNRVVDAVAAGRDPASEIDVDEWQAALLAIWRQVFEALDDEKSKATRSELVALVQQIIDSPTRAREIARFLDEASAGITTTTRRRLATILADTTVTDRAAVLDNLRRLYATEFVGTRSNLIALDNVLRSTATFDFEQAVVEQDGLRRDNVEIAKSWMTQGDARVRDSHQAAQGQTRRLDDPFIVGGVSLRYPRDPAGATGETINCRCVMITRRRRKPKT